MPQQPSNFLSRENKTILSAVVEDARREPQWQDDSLSSLSIESEDDTNLLSQVIEQLSYYFKFKTEFLPYTYMSTYRLLPQVAIGPNQI